MSEDDRDGYPADGLINLIAQIIIVGYSSRRVWYGLCLQCGYLLNQAGVVAISYYHSGFDWKDQIRGNNIFFQESECG